MKHLSIILLSLWMTIISLFPKTDVCYLVDMPTLVEHYQEHQKTDNLSFWQFIVMHYTHSEHKSQEHEKHKHLPFQHHHVECCSVLVLETKSLQIHRSYSLSIEKTLIFPNRQDLYHYQPLKGIFQPPKYS